MHGVLGWSYEGLQTRLNGSERFVWLAGTSGLVLIVLLSALVGLSSSPAVGKVILVLLLFTTAPFFARILIVPATWKVNAAEKAVLILNVVFIALGLIWILALYENLTSFPVSPWALSLLYCFALVPTLLISWVRSDKPKNMDDQVYMTLPVWIVPLMAVLPATLIIATLLPGNVAAFDGRAGSTAAAIAVATLFFWRLKMFEETTTPTMKLLAWSVTAITLLSPLLMMDVELSYDALHYTAYLAPSLAVQGGGIPLVDVFCQYGLCYLIFNLFFLVFPPTFHSAALLVTIINTATTMLGLAIMRRLIKNHLVFAILGLSLPFLLVLIYHYAPNNTPSHGGLRYFPVFAVATSLVYLPPCRRFSAWSITAVILASFWSFEALVYGILIYVAFLAAATTVESEQLWPFLKQVGMQAAKLAAAIVCAFGVALAAFMMQFHQVPRYDLYLSTISAYVGPDHSLGYFQYQPGYYWIPMLLGYFLAICVIFHAIFLRQRGSESWVPRLAVLTGLGMIMALYCLLMTLLHQLKVGLLPFLIIFVWAIQVELTRSGSSLFRLTPLSISLVFIVVSALMTGVAGETLATVGRFGSPNTSVLRHLIDERRPIPANFWERLKNSCVLMEASGTACSPGPQLPPMYYEEFKDLLHRWFANEDRVLAFQPAEAIIRVLVQKPHALPLSDSYHDGFSPALFRFVAARSSHVIERDLYEGQPVLIAKDQASLNELQWALLSALNLRWQLEKVDETEHLAVYRLRRESTPDRKLLLIDRPVKTRNIPHNFRNQASVMPETRS